ncbi:protein of unknown function [Tepidibacter aestuarii]|nr:protein of unknown function [Tepidibacter aestuarii]
MGNYNIFKDHIKFQKNIDSPVAGDFIIINVKEMAIIKKYKSFHIQKEA